MQKLLPPLLFGIFLLLIISLNLWLAKDYSWWLGAVGGALFLVGLGLASSGSRLFQRVETNIMTFGEPDKLVTQGLFTYSRNPMYLGFVLALCGGALATGNTI